MDDPRNTIDRDRCIETRFLSFDRLDRPCGRGVLLAQIPVTVEAAADAVLGVKVIGQLVSPIKLFPAHSAVILGQFPALESLVSAQIRHPLVPLPAFAAHVILYMLSTRRARYVRPDGDRCGLVALGVRELQGGKLVHQDAAIWNANEIGYRVSDRGRRNARLDSIENPTKLVVRRRT